MEQLVKLFSRHEFDHGSCVEIDKYLKEGWIVKMIIPNYAPRTIESKETRINQIETHKIETFKEATEYLILFEREYRN